MNEKELRSKLGIYWASVIRKFDLDLLRKRITLEVETVDGGLRQNHSLMFSDVVSFFFAKYSALGNGGIPIPYEEGDYLELSEIYYSKDAMGLIKVVSDEQVFQNYGGYPNFYLEIWSDALLIEAYKVTIDGENIELS